MTIFTNKIRYVFMEDGIFYYKLELEPFEKITRKKKCNNIYVLINLV